MLWRNRKSHPPPAFNAGILWPPNGGRFFSVHPYSPLVVAVSNDEGSKKRVEIFSKLLNLSFPILLDPEKNVSDPYKVSSMPTSYLIDSNGKIISRIVGTEEWFSAEAIQLVEELLTQSMAQH